MRIVCIADTHELHRELAVPPGDLLIHAGDITAMLKRPGCTATRSLAWVTAPSPQDRHPRKQRLPPGGPERALASGERTRVRCNAGRA